MTPRARWPVVTVGVACIAVAVAAVPMVQGVLIGSRAGILDLELWRVLTAHVVHASTYHLAIDLTAWLIVGAMYEPRLGARFGWIAGASAIAVGAGVSLALPDIGYYTGLSGVTAGVWAGGAASCAWDALDRDDRRGMWIHGAILAAAVAKILAEALYGSALDPATLGAEPLPIAHVIGATGGLGATIATGPR